MNDVTTAWATAQKLAFSLAEQAAAQMDQRWLRCPQCRVSRHATRDQSPPPLCERCRVVPEGLAGPRLCDTCESATRGYLFSAQHPQRHSEVLGFCVDAAVIDLVEALTQRALMTTTSCQGSPELFVGKVYVGFERQSDMLRVVRAALAAVPADQPHLYYRVRGMGNPFQTWAMDLSLYGRDGEELEEGVVLALPLDHVGFLIDVVRALPTIE